MLEFDEGKAGLRSTQIANRRRFFDDMHKGASFDSVEEETVAVKEAKKVKDSKKEGKADLNDSEKNIAEKFLKKALKESFEKKTEKEKITNVRGKKLLNSEISAIALLAGKDILEDEFIIKDIAESLHEDEEFSLPKAYERRMEDIFDKLSVSRINELLFDFYLNGEIDKEIVKLKKAAVEENIYQGKIKELNSDTISELKTKILEELTRISKVKEDYLAGKEKKNDYVLIEDYIDEIKSIIHSIIMDEMLTDEISIPLNIASSQSVESHEIDMVEHVDIVSSETEKEKENGDTMKKVTLEIKNEAKENAAIEKKDEEKRENVIKGCEELKSLLSSKLIELKDNAVTDEDKMEAVFYEKEFIDPIAEYLRKLIFELDKNENDIDDLRIVFEEIKEKADRTIKELEDLISEEKKKEADEQDFSHMTGETEGFSLDEKSEETEEIEQDFSHVNEGFSISREDVKEQDFSHISEVNEGFSVAKDEEDETNLSHVEGFASEKGEIPLYNELDLEKVFAKFPVQVVDVFRRYCLILKSNDEVKKLSKDEITDYLKRNLLEKIIENKEFLSKEYNFEEKDATILAEEIVKEI